MERFIKYLLFTFINMAQNDMTGLSEAQVNGLQSLSGRKSREDYRAIIIEYLKLEKEDSSKARSYFLQESAKIPNFGRDFLGVDGLENGIECYSPNIDRFLMIDPNSEAPTTVLNPREFKVFLRSGATSSWQSGGPGEEGYTSVGEKLSTIENPTQYFPGFKCIDDTVDRQLRQDYRGMRFNIPLTKGQ